MFDQLLSRQFHILRHRSGPYSEERQQYLSFLIQEGRSRSTLQASAACCIQSRSCSRWTYQSRFLRSKLRLTSYGRPRHCSQRSLHVVKRWFVYHATRWLRLLGHLHEPLPNRLLGRNWKHFSRSRCENGVWLQRRS